MTDYENITCSDFNGDTLYEEYHEKLVTGLKYKYFLAKLFSIFLMFGTGFAGVRTIVSYLFDEEFNEGFFQYLPIKLIVIAMTVLFVCGVFIAGYKLYRTVTNMTGPAERGEFVWYKGRLTDKERITRRHGTASYYLYIDGVKCVPLDFNSEDYKNAVLGNEFIVIRFAKSSMVFALKP